MIEFSNKLSQIIDTLATKVLVTYVIRF